MPTVLNSLTTVKHTLSVYVKKKACEADHYDRCVTQEDRNGQQVDAW